MTRPGSTLVELIVALALIGVMSAVTVLALRSTPVASTEDTAIQRLMDARRIAVREGRRMTIELMVGNARHSATAHPDGRIVTSASLGVNSLSGRLEDAER